MRFSVSAFDIANSVGVLIDIVQRSQAGPNGTAPKVLMMVPPPVGKLTDFAEMFTGAESKSHNFAEEYRRVADEYQCEILDTSEIIVSSDVDGVHFDVGEHQKLGLAVVAKIQQILK
jgi:lysophospholipase L1-like esterase